MGQSPERRVHSPLHWLAMAFKILLLLTLLRCSSGACTADDETCMENYPGKESEVSEDVALLQHETLEADQRIDFPGCKAVCRKPLTDGCRPVNILNMYDVGPSAGSLKTAKGCRKIGSLFKAGSASLCNGDWATCCPSWLVPICYIDDASLGLVQQVEPAAPALVVNNRWDVPGCHGVCRKPLKVNCHSVNLLTKYDLGPECGSLKTAKGCKKMGSLTKSASCSLCNEFPSATCCPSWLVP